jgi:hypothetical protein
MQITHEDARKWIHLDSDSGLNTIQKQLLNSHLSSCINCRNYAHSIRRMESALRPLMQRQWNRQPVPLPVGSLVSRGHTKIAESMILATRIAAIGVMFIAFLFTTLQFTTPGSRGSSPVLANVPSMPIPSTSTQLINTQPVCGNISYVVQKNDTLAGIASQYSVAVEELIQVNALTSNTMITGQELVVPACTSTPTSTLDPLPATLTPVLGRLTSTPGG